MWHCAPIAGGRTLACDDFEGALRLADVDSGQVIFERKQFVRPTPIYNFFPRGSLDLPNGKFLGDLGHACLDFSPDSLYFIALPCHGDGTEVAYDVSRRALVRLPRGSREVTDGWQTFIAPHRLLFSPPPYQAKHSVVRARIVAFPSAKTVATARIPSGPLWPATDPAWVVARRIRARSGSMNAAKVCGRLSRCVSDNTMDRRTISQGRSSRPCRSSAVKNALKY